MRSAARTGVAVLLSLACTSSAREYRDPDPALGPTALVVITNPFEQAPFTSTSRAMAHVYEGGEECAETYLGSVNLNLSDQQVRVAADRTAIFRLSISIDETYGSATCNSAIGFVPRADRRYRLRFQDHLRVRCGVDLVDDAGRPVARFDPRYCESP